MVSIDGMECAGTSATLSELQPLKRILSIILLYLGHPGEDDIPGLVLLARAAQELGGESIFLLYLVDEADT